MHDGDREAAGAALQQAVDVDPSNAEALMALAQLYRDDRDYNRAELLLQRASAFDLHRENAVVSLAQLANFERALELLRDVANRNPARTDLRRNIDSLENLVLLRTDTDLRLADATVQATATVPIAEVCRETGTVGAEAGRVEDPQVSPPIENSQEKESAAPVSRAGTIVDWHSAVDLNFTRKLSRKTGCSGTSGTIFATAHAL